MRSENQPDARRNWRRRAGELSKNRAPDGAQFDGETGKPVQRTVWVSAPDQMTGLRSLEHRRARFELRAHVESGRTGGDADADDGGGCDQRNRDDLEMGQADRLYANWYCS